MTSLITKHQVYIPCITNQKQRRPKAWDDGVAPSVTGTLAANHLPKSLQCKDCDCENYVYLDYFYQQLLDIYDTAIYY